MNTKRDKVIAEALGLEYAAELASGDYFARRMSTYHNPDFSTAEGMLLILRKGPERGPMNDDNGLKLWDRFMSYLEDKNLAFWYLDGSYIHQRLLQDPNRLANELEQFLDAREGVR